MDRSERYSRQIMLPELGIQGQDRLASARVLLVGVGGLGSPIATYLCAGGIGRLGIVDDDCVSISNLQRQVLYKESELGKSKALCAAIRLGELNSEMKIDAYNCRLTGDNALDIIKDYDIVVDGCDNFETRFIINDACLKLGKAYVYGSIRGLEGQVSVFGVPGPDGKIRSYRELYDEDELRGLSVSKAVLGATPGVVGTVEAAQVMLLAAGAGEVLIGRLWTINLLDMNSLTIQF